jgi:hypothetical protein
MPIIKLQATPMLDRRAVRRRTRAQLAASPQWRVVGMLMTFQTRRVSGRKFRRIDRVETAESSVYRRL